MRRPKFLLPAAILAGLVVLALAVHGHPGWDTLAANRDALRVWVARAPVASALAYCVLYAVSVGLSLPLSVLLTVTGGFLFGALVGAALAVLSAASGATLLFLLARGVFAPLVARGLTRRAAPLLERVRPGLQRDGFCYLLALRLLPMVPFWFANLAPALLGMRLAPFAAATLLGILPATTLLAAIGAGFGDALAAGGMPDLSVLTSPTVLLPLTGLAMLSLAPVAWRRWRRHGG